MKNLKRQMVKGRSEGGKAVSPVQIPCPRHSSAFPAFPSAVALSRVKNERIHANSSPSVESGFICGQNCFDQCKSLLANRLEDDHSQSKSIKVTFICFLKSRCYEPQKAEGRAGSFCRDCFASWRLCCSNCSVALSQGESKRTRTANAQRDGGCSTCCRCVAPNVAC